MNVQTQTDWVDDKNVSLYLEVSSLRFNRFIINAFGARKVTFILRIYKKKTLLKLEANFQFRKLGT